MATVHVFRSSGDRSDSSSILHGAFIQVPEGCLIHAWAPDSPEMAVLTTFAVASIEETLGRVVASGGRVHSYVLLPAENSPLLPQVATCFHGGD